MRLSAGPQDENDWLREELEDTERRLEEALRWHLTPLHTSLQTSPHLPLHPQQARRHRGGEAAVALHGAGDVLLFLVLVMMLMLVMMLNLLTQSHVLT